MSFTTTAECFVRLSATDAKGQKHTVEVPLGERSSDEYGFIFMKAHQNADGSLPTPAQCNFDGWLFSAVNDLRKAEDELKKLVGES